MSPISTGLFYFLVIAFSALAIGSIIRLISLSRSKSKISGQVASARRSSLLVWWILMFAFAAALILGRGGLAILFCVASLLALHEFHELFRRHSMDAPILRWTIGMIAVVHYFILAVSDAVWSLIAFPVVTLVIVTTVEIATGRSQDYLRTTAGYYWAALLIVFGLSHAVLTTQLPAAEGTWSAGTLGWCIFLVILTELNDIAQALIGRVFGRHKVTPAFSPGKTWEGLAGGFIVTTLLAVVTAPWLTTLTVDRPSWQGVLISFGAGAVLSLAGFLGDVNMSGLKREAGVKDSGSLLPGMGGMIDRIDSLTISAPAFYYYVLSVSSL